MSGHVNWHRGQTHGGQADTWWRGGFRERIRKFKMSAKPKVLGKACLKQTQEEENGKSCFSK